MTIKILFNSIRSLKTHHQHIIESHQRLTKKHPIEIQLYPILILLNPWKKSLAPLNITIKIPSHPIKTPWHPINTPVNIPWISIKFSKHHENSPWSCKFPVKSPWHVHWLPISTRKKRRPSSFRQEQIKEIAAQHPRARNVAVDLMVFIHGIPLNLIC